MVRVGNLGIAALAWFAAACGGPGGTSGGQGAAAVGEGRALYGRYGCAACHGEEGHGDGPMAERLRARPRDFHDAEAFRYGHTHEAIAKSIAEGGFPGAGMPAFRDIPEPQRAALGAFIASLHGGSGSEGGS